MNTSTNAAASAAALPATSHLASDSLCLFVESSRAYGSVQLRIGPPDTVPMGLRASFDLSPDTARDLGSRLIAHADALDGKAGGFMGALNPDQVDTLSKVATDITVRALLDMSPTDARELARLLLIQAERAEVQS